MSDECTNCDKNSDVSTVVAVCAFIRSADQLGTLLAAVQDTVPFTSKCTQTRGLTAHNSGMPAGP